MFHERLLERVKITVVGQALDGDHLLVFNVFHGRSAGSNGFIVHKNSASAAVTFPASVLGPRQSQVSA